MYRTVTSIVEGSITPETRRSRSMFLARERPGYVPVFLKYHVSNELYRYLIHRDTYVSYLLIAFRKRIKSSSAAIIPLIERKEGDVVHSLLVSSTWTLGYLYDEYCHDDGFVYINLTRENVFG